MIRFCSSGTVAAPISTPRSPRATITASASMQHLLERLDRLGLLDLRDHAGRRAVLADDRLQVADVGRGAHERQRDEVDARARARSSRSSRSFFVSDGIGTGTPGRLTPLCDLTSPPTTTRQRARPCSTSSTREPDEAVVDQDVVARPQHLADHGGRDRQLAVRRRLLADDEDLLVLQQDARRRRGRRSAASGPAGRRSARAACRSPSCTSRTTCARAAWSSWLPCERLRRIASTPASTSARTASWVDETGPIVATIFVLRRTAAMPPRLLHPP